MPEPLPPPDQVAQVSSLGTVIVGWLATLIGAAITAWRVRGRRESRVLYVGAPDDQPRRISRKEWHDHVDKVHAHELAIPVILHQHATLRGEFDNHVRRVEGAIGGFDRLEERIAGLVKRWDDSEERSAHERAEILSRIESVHTRLDRVVGRD